MFPQNASVIITLEDFGFKLVTETFIPSQHAKQICLRLV